MQCDIVSRIDSDDVADAECDQYVYAYPHSEKRRRDMTFSMLVS